MTQDELTLRARQEAARALGLQIEQVTLERIEEIDWPDASLGCPEPGRMYAQVITPGYRVVLRASGQEHVVHADQSGRVVYCRNPAR